MTGMESWCYSVFDTETYKPYNYNIIYTLFQIWCLWSESFNLSVLIHCGYESIADS
jgi:hypothetical protein